MVLSYRGGYETLTWTGVWNCRLNTHDETGFCGFDVPTSRVLWHGLQSFQVGGWQKTWRIKRENSPASFWCGVARIVCHDSFVYWSEIILTIMIFVNFVMVKYSGCTDIVESSMVGRPCFFVIHLLVCFDGVDWHGAYPAPVGHHLITTRSALIYGLLETGTPPPEVKCDDEKQRCWGLWNSPWENKKHQKIKIFFNKRKRISVQ